MGAPVGGFTATSMIEAKRPISLGCGSLGIFKDVPYDELTLSGTPRESPPTIPLTSPKRSCTPFGNRRQSSIWTEKRDGSQAATLVLEEGRTASVGEGPPPPGEYDRTINAQDCVVLPGLVNTHHHFVQTLNRCYPPALDAGLFPWLEALYPVWAKIDPEVVRLGTTVALAELLLSGCTTACDHHCFVPRGGKGHFDVQVEAAKELGARFHVTRGWMSVGRSKGGLPPDENCEDEVLADCEAVIAKYHDPSRGGP